MVNMEIKSDLKGPIALLDLSKSPSYLLAMYASYLFIYFMFVLML